MDGEVLRLEAQAEDAGKRLDGWLAGRCPGLTRSFIQKLLENGQALIDGVPSGKKDKNRPVAPGMVVSLALPEPEPLELKPENIPLEIVYEDKDLLVVNKPKGMVVHPAPGHNTGTLVHALLYHCGDSLSGINGVQRPGIVHRIDRDTSGLLMVAKSDRAHLGLASQIQDHSFSRTYEAVVYGNIKEEGGTLRDYLGRSKTDRKKMAVVPPSAPDAREAVTHFTVLERFGNFTHVRLQLETGRTHQIRVQMAYFGHPVAGDPVYGPSKVIAWLNGQCLHARTLGFTHPVTGEWMAFTAPLPDYFTRFLQKLRRGDNPQTMEGVLMVCDCDGTLLCRDDTLPEENVQAVEAFQAAGGRFTLATGRPWPMVKRFAERLSITTPMVLLNGGMIYDPVAEKPLWYAELPEQVKPLVLKVMEDFKDAPGGVPGIEVFAPDMIYLLNWHPYMQWHLIDRYPVPFEKAGFEKVANLPWCKLMFDCDAEYMESLIKYLDKQGLSGVQLVRSDRMLYEVLPRESGKGQGVRRLCGMLGQPEARLAAMGDFDNDREMMALAAFPIAPANASPEIKALSALVTGADNASGAVAEGITYIMRHRSGIFRPGNRKE